MANIEKPNMSTLWAEDGAIITPSDEKIALGWIAEIPPHQWENFAQNRQDQAIAYLLQKGVPEWDSETEYQGNSSIIQKSGKLYLSLTTNINKDPATNPADWKDLGASASTGSEGVVALATNAETQAGVVNNKAVTPASLQSKVTSSPTDGTAGRLLKVGDFGLGAANLVFLSNINTMTVRTGTYVVSSSSTTGTFPPSSPDLGIVQVLANQGGSPSTNQWIKQVFYDLNSDKVWQRYSTNNAPWSAWVEGMQILQTAPTEDRGPIYVPGQGTMEWAGDGYYPTGGGAKGGGGNQIFYENDTEVTSSYTITSGKNAMTAGPITINDGVTITVTTGSTWVIV